MRSDPGNTHEQPIWPKRSFARGRMPERGRFAGSQRQQVANDLPRITADSRSLVHRRADVYKEVDRNDPFGLDAWFCSPAA